MKLLKQLLPAEALLLTEGKACKVGHYLKATFMDLLLKQVLKSTSNNGVTDSPDATGDKWVGPGKNYFAYQPTLYEQPLLALFDTASGAYGREYFLFSQVVKVAYKKAGIASVYRQKIYQNSHNPQWYKQNFWIKMFGGFALTEVGQQAQQELKTEIAILEGRLASYMQNDMPRAQELLREIKGHIFLLKNIDLAALDAIDKDLLIEVNQRHSSDDSSVLVAASFMAVSSGTWDSYHDYSGSWDSSCSNDNSSGHSSTDGSGCSGDGGCSSGCSGCGGGCGGGD